MKAIYLTNSLLHTDGWGRVSCEIIKRLPENGIEPVVIAPDPADVEFGKKIEVVKLLNREGDYFTPWNVFIATLRAKGLLNGVAFVHCLTEPLFGLAYALAAAAKIPLFLTIHGTYALKPRCLSGRYWYNKAYSYASQVFSDSTYTLQKVIEQRPRIKSKCGVVPLGVSDRFFIRSVPEIEERGKQFVSVGHVKSRKGMAETIIAFREAVAQYKDAKLNIIGPCLDGKYLSILKTIIRDFELEENVSFMGQISDDELVWQISHARGLIMPSINKDGHFEGFGLVHLEAQALGTPSVGSFDCGNEEVIQNGKTGFLVRQGDISEISRAMFAILKDDKFNELSKNAVSYARGFTWDKTVKSYIMSYQI